MTIEDVDRFEKIVGQLQGVYDELTILSKKAPNDALSKFKVKYVNKLLVEGHELLGEHYQPFNDFSAFDADDVPQNSDVVFMLTQYLQCFEKLRADNVIKARGNWYWNVEAPDHPQANDQGRIHIQTVIPNRLRS